MKVLIACSLLLLVGCQSSKTGVTPSVEEAGVSRSSSKRLVGDEVIQPAAAVLCLPIWVLFPGGCHFPCAN